MPHSDNTANDIRGKHRFKSQLRALFLKNLSLQRNQWRTSLCQILVPIVLVSIIGLFQIIMDNQFESIKEVQPPSKFARYKVGQTVTQYPWSKFSSDGLPLFGYVVENRTQVQIVGEQDFRNLSSFGWLSNVKVEEVAPGAGFFLPFFDGSCETLGDFDQHLIDIMEYWRKELDDYLAIAPKLSQKVIKRIRKRLVNWLLAGNYTRIPPMQGWIFHDLKDRSGSTINITVMPGSRYNSWTPLDYHYQNTSISLHEELYREPSQISTSINIINNALFKDWTGSDEASIHTYFQGMTELVVNKLDISAIVGVNLFAFAVSFLIPPFVTNVVIDKQDKILALMQMSGLKMPVYWFVTYLYYFAQYILVMIFLVATALSFQMRLFTQTSPLLLLVSILIWGNALVAFSFFLSIFFDKARHSSMVSYFIVVMGVLVSNMLNGSVFMTDSPPFWYLLYPPFAFYRLIFILEDACINFVCMDTQSMLHLFFGGKSGSMPVDSTSQLATILLLLILESIFMFFVSWYGYELLPKEYGVRRQWNFCLPDFRKQFSRNNRATSDEWDNRNDSLQSIRVDLDKTSIDEDSLDDEADVEKGLMGPLESAENEILDDDVIAEMRSVIEDNPRNYSLSVEKLSKKYCRKKRMALKDFYLNLKPGEVFGLLGANGSGKTTLISCLTGLIQPSYGTARFFNGKLDLKTNMESVQSRIGVCLQFDVFYPKLTCLEHVLFYSRLKGYPERHIKSHCLNVLEQVGLDEDAQKLAYELSGGMRRRLSIAIALSGHVDLLFLDEPSTGLDPLTRRDLWSVFSSIVEKRKAEDKSPLTVILTTHAMDEADLLCDRIAVMEKGIMKCIGSPEYLKSKFSVGYTLQMSLSPLQMESQFKHFQSDKSKPIQLLKLLQFAIGLDDEHSSSRPDLLLFEGMNNFGLSTNQTMLRLLPDQSLGYTLVFQIKTRNNEMFAGWNTCFKYLDEAKNTKRPICIPIWLSGYSSKQAHDSSSDGNKEFVEVALEDWGISMTTLEDVFMSLVKY